MNSNYGKSNPQKSSSVSLNNFNFDLDLGLGSNKPKSLKDQKNPNPLNPNPNSNSYSYSTTSYSSAQPKKPTWTHQPAPPPVGLPGAPPSMVGDIFGKSWGSTQPSSSGPSIGIVNKNPNLFGDLVSSVLDSKTSSSSANVPLKNATPTPNNNNKSSFSMSNMANSLPKTTNTPPSGSTWGSSSTNFNMNNNNNANKTPNLGGPSIKSVSGSSGMNSNNKDPFSSLSGFGSKQSVNLNSAAKPQKIDLEDDGFGDFKSASKSSSTAFPSSAGVGIDVDFIGSTTKAPNQTPVQASSGGGGDPMDMFFTSSSGGGGGGAAVASSEMDDWGMDSEFGGGVHDDGGTTTELEGLPPPPAGVSGSSAKGKGMDNYKQGQFADAIKWLSWAVILLEKAGDDAGSAEVLSCRASCYKEVGEYKKAVADCTKLLEVMNIGGENGIQRENNGEGMSLVSKLLQASSLWAPQLMYGKICKPDLF